MALKQATQVLSALVLIIGAIVFPKVDLVDCALVIRIV